MKKIKVESGPYFVDKGDYGVIVIPDMVHKGIHFSVLLHFIERGKSTKFPELPEVGIDHNNTEIVIESELKEFLAE
jgi:hypothetical protein